MPLTFEQVAKKTLLCSALVQQNVRDRAPIHEDIQALSACVFQLAALIAIIAPETTAIIPQDGLTPPFLPVEYAKALSDQFRDSLESDRESPH